TGTPPDDSPPVRTVSVRNPLGEGPANNLLLDGDFETSVSYGTGQYGWRMFDSSGSGEKPMNVETGGLCRSGLSCVKLHKGELMLGRGTAAALGKGHVMEAYTKVPDGVACAKVQVIAVECDSFGVLKAAKADKDLDNGWCHLS